MLLKTKMIWAGKELSGRSFAHYVCGLGSTENQSQNQPNKILKPGLGM